MIEVVENDDRRNVEITIQMTDDHQVVGCEIWLNCPIPLYKFSFANIGMVQGCGGCSDKGLPRSPLTAVGGK